jgi:hypothetical protein
VTFFGETRSLDNETEVSAFWHREVVAAETVTVEAGSFASYELNQSLGTFPGILVMTGNNETAYFSNEVGFVWESTVGSLPGDIPKLSVIHYLKSILKETIAVGPLTGYPSDVSAGLAVVVLSVFRSR